VGDRTQPQATRKLDKKPEYTSRQGQFLAFIHYYAKLNGCPPAEEDMARYFRITPPSAHWMVVALEQRGLIKRVLGQARSIRLMLRREDLPDLD
jgi:repressor LexA